MKRSLLIAGILVTVMTVLPAGAVLVNNGGFDEDAADWNAAGGGAWAPAHVAEGGNPGGYLTLESGNNVWSVWYQVGTESLAEWGIPADIGVVTVNADMIDLGTLGNNNQGGLKAESWAGETKLTPGDGVNVLFTVGTSWEPVSFDYTLESGSDSLKIILVNVNYNGLGTAKYGYDNVAITIPGGTPALKPVPAVGGGVNPLAPVVSWTNPDPNFPGDTLTADVFVLESDVLLTEDPNMGPLVLDPGVVMVANDIAAESVDLLAAGYPVQADKYYYWAVHLTDPTAGAIEGFTWYFQTFDSPPSNADAGADQYLWLTMDDGTPADGKVTFTLTGSVDDDGKSPLTTTWSLDADQSQTDPATTVVIDNPNALTTTVTIDNTGWFFFTFTAEDEIGSVSDVVNVGVYGSACEAANEDPADIPARYPNGHGDINGDCEVDLEDLALMAASWIDCMSDKLGCTP